MIPQKIKFVITCTSPDCNASREAREESISQRTLWREKINNSLCKHWKNIKLETQEEECDTSEGWGVFGYLSKAVNASWLVQWSIEAKCQCDREFSNNHGWWGWPNGSQWKRDFKCDTCQAELDCFVYQTTGEEWIKISKEATRFGVNPDIFLGQGTARRLAIEDSNTRSGVFENFENFIHGEKVENPQKEENIKLQNELKEVKLELKSKEKELQELSKKDIAPLLAAKESAWQNKFQSKQKEIKELQAKIQQLEKEIIDNANLKEKPRTSVKKQSKTITANTSISSYNWTNIHPNFTPNLINNWQISSFTYQQTQEWINIGLQPNDWAFCWWLKNCKKLTAEQVLNNHNLEQLKTEHQQFKAQIQIPPK